MAMYISDILYRKFVQIFLMSINSPGIGENPDYHLDLSSVR